MFTLVLLHKFLQVVKKNMSKIPDLDPQCRRRRIEIYRSNPYLINIFLKNMW